MTQMKIIKVYSKLKPQFATAVSTIRGTVYSPTPFYVANRSTRAALKSIPL